MGASLGCCLIRKFSTIYAGCPNCYWLLLLLLFVWTCRKCQLTWQDEKVLGCSPATWLINHWRDTNRRTDKQTQVERNLFYRQSDYPYHNPLTLAASLPFYVPHLITRCVPHRFETHTHSHYNTHTRTYTHLGIGRHPHTVRDLTAWH